MVDIIKNSVFSENMQNFTLMISENMHGLYFHFLTKDIKAAATFFHTNMDLPVLFFCI